MSTRLRVTLLAAGFLALLTLTLVGLWTGVQGRALRVEQLRRVRLSTDLVAELSSEALAEGNILRLAYMADTVAGKEGVSRVMVVDRTGEIIVDSRHTGYGAKPDLVVRTLRTGRSIVSEGSEAWYATSVVRNQEGQMLGCVMIEFSTGDLWSAQRSTRLLGALIAIVGILVGSLLAYIAARLITKPLEKLLAGIRRLQTGEPGEPVPSSVVPEMAEIGTSFNTMAGLVRERERRLELLNQMAASLPLAADLHGIASIVRRYADSIMGARTYIWIADRLSRELLPVPAEGQEPASRPLPVDSDCMVGRSFTEERVIISGDRRSGPPAGSLVTCGLSAKSAIAAPLATIEGVVGVLVIADPWDDSSVSAEDEALAVAISNATAPIVMARLRDEAQARAAAALQSLLVPAVLPEIGIDLYVAYSPAESIAGVGGDFYDFVPVDDTKWAVIVGDTAGKGLEAARFAATAKYVIRSYILESGDPAEAMNWSNRALVAQEELGVFVTVFCGVLDIRSGALLHTNAAHVAPIIYRHCSGQADYLGARGLPLGVSPDSVYIDEQVQLRSGDIMCVFTDGVTEARQNSEWFGPDRVTDLIREMADCTSRQIGERILQEVKSFSDGRLRDDIALVVLKMP